MVLGIGSVRAMWRQIRGASNWEKTTHIGQHKASTPRQKGFKAMPQQQGQDSRPIPSQQPGASDRPLSFTGPFPSRANPSRQQAFPLPRPPASPPPLQHRWSPEKEKDAASLTVFRTANFFVQAFAPHLR